MKNISRKQFILNKLQEQGSVTITELAEELQVSSMTIRRDLAALSSNGLVTLEHGGAMLNSGSMFEYTNKKKNEYMSQEKKKIAQKCLEYITEGDSVFLDAGTTAACVAELLRSKKNLIVMTHSLLAANALANAKKIKHIMCPGEFREQSMAYMGPLTDEFIENFQIDTLFLCVEGIDVEQGVSVVDILDGNTKKVLVKKARKVICIADHSKFNKSFFYKIRYNFYLTPISLFIINHKKRNKRFVPF